MAKLQPIPRYTADGTKKTSGYKMTISKGDAEKAGFDENSILAIISKKGELKIVEKK